MTIITRIRCKRCNRTSRHGKEPVGAGCRINLSTRMPVEQKTTKSLLAIHALEKAPWCWGSEWQLKGAARSRAAAYTNCELGRFWREHKPRKPLHQLQTGSAGYCCAKLLSFFRRAAANSDCSGRALLHVNFAVTGLGLLKLVGNSWKLGYGVVSHVRANFIGA